MDVIVSQRVFILNEFAPGDGGNARLGTIAHPCAVLFCRVDPRRPATAIRKVNG